MAYTTTRNSVIGVLKLGFIIKARTFELGALIRLFFKLLVQ